MSEIKLDTAEQVTDGTEGVCKVDGRRLPVPPGAIPPGDYS